MTADLGFLFFAYRSKIHVIATEWKAKTVKTDRFFFIPLINYVAKSSFHDLSPKIEYKKLQFCWFDFTVNFQNGY